MKKLGTAIAMTLAFCLAGPARAADPVHPVRMGCGLMTFDTVPGWGLAPDGKSVIGPCHGSVVVDTQGHIYTSAEAGVFVFDPDGKVVRRFLGDKYSNIHDMKIRSEADGEFIYAARNADAQGIKFSAHTGEIVLKLPFPQSSGLNLKQFNPTAMTIAPSGARSVCDSRARHSKYHQFVGQAKMREPSWAWPAMRPGHRSQTGAHAQSERMDGRHLSSTPAFLAMTAPQRTSVS